MVTEYQHGKGNSDQKEDERSPIWSYHQSVLPFTIDDQHTLIFRDTSSLLSYDDRSTVSKLSVKSSLTNHDEKLVSDLDKSGDTFSKEQNRPMPRTPVFCELIVD